MLCSPYIVSQNPVCFSNYNPALFCLHTAKSKEPERVTDAKVNRGEFLIAFMRLLCYKDWWLGLNKFKYNKLWTVLWMFLHLCVRGLTQIKELIPIAICLKWLLCLITAGFTITQTKILTSSYEVKHMKLTVKQTLSSLSSQTSHHTTPWGLCTLTVCSFTNRP